MARLSSTPGNLEDVEWASLSASQVEPLHGSIHDAELPDATEVVIVGGGYTGLSAALALGRRGVRRRSSRPSVSAGVPARATAG